MCPDYRRSHLHGRLDLLHGLPHPPETPSIQNIVIVLPLQADDGLMVVTVCQEL